MTSSGLVFLKRILSDAHIEKKMFAIDWTPNAAESATKIMALETVLATNHMKKRGNQKHGKTV
jgi:hypothetical protein